MHKVKLTVVLIFVAFLSWLQQWQQGNTLMTATWCLSPMEITPGITSGIDDDPRNNVTWKEVNLMGTPVRYLQPLYMWNETLVETSEGNLFDMAVVVVSSAKDEGRRNLIRATWGESVKGNLIFVVSASHDTSNVHMEEKNFSNIEKEYEERGDLLLVDRNAFSQQSTVDVSYATVKVLVALSVFGSKGHKYIFKTVDDAQIDIQGIKTTLLHGSQQKNLDYWGKCQAGKVPEFVSGKGVVPATMMSYANGLGYLMSQKFVDCVLRYNQQLSVPQLAEKTKHPLSLPDGAFIGWMGKKSCNLRCSPAKRGEISAWDSKRAIYDKNIKTEKDLEALKAIYLTERASTIVANNVSEPMTHPSHLPKLVKPSAAVLLFQREHYPMVFTKHKLIFFNIPKVASTTMKRLFRRMNGFKDYRTIDLNILWDRRRDGIRYLENYPKETVSEWLTSPEWTRAVFLREPKSRFLSAYLDKAVQTNWAFDHCCKKGSRYRWPKTDAFMKKCKEKITSFSGFVDEAVFHCDDAHWAPYTASLPEPFFARYINFVGHSETAQEDTKRLLTRIGGGKENLWQQYGATGWGGNGTGPIFETVQNPHATSASSKLLKYFNETRLHRLVEKFYEEDYRIFNFTEEI